MSTTRGFTTGATRVGFVAALYAATFGLFYLAATREYREMPRFDSLRVILLVLLTPLLVKYIVQLVCSPVYSLHSRRRTRSATHRRRPSVSVLVPAWNEEVGIVKTVRSVLNTGYPDLQVVVVNDGSTDGTHDEVTRFLAEHDRSSLRNPSIEYLRLPNGGKARALNRALVHATGEIIITVDADSVMDADAIDNLVKHFDDPSVGGVAGNVVVANRETPIAWIQQMEYLYGFFFKRSDSVFNSVYIMGGAAAAYRREVLQEIGGFDPSIITEDIEMSTRILSRGHKTRYASDAVVYTEAPSSVGGLCNQRLRWKYGRLLTFLKHRKLFFSVRPEHSPYLTFLVLPLAVYAELLLLAEVVLLGAFFLYTIITNDYMPLACVIGILTSVVYMQILVDPKARFHRNLLCLAPAAWLLFYFVDMIELQALVRSLKRLITRTELEWQKWVRVGVADDSCIDTSTCLRLVDTDPVVVPDSDAAGSARTSRLGRRDVASTVRRRQVPWDARRTETARQRAGVPGTDLGEDSAITPPNDRPVATSVRAASHHA